MKRRSIWIVATVLAGAALLLTANYFIYTKVIRPVFTTKTYYSRGESMAPTIVYNERYQVEQVKPEKLRRGDIVMALDKRNPDALWAVRIIAMGGDQIEIRSGTVYLNGNRLDEPYVKKPANTNYALETVPPGHLFVMGDNRGASYDSRFYGPIPLSNVKGRVVGK